MKNNFIPILTPYFDWLTDTFGNFARQVKKNNITSGTIAQDYLSDEGRRSRFLEQLPSLFNQVENFWKQNRRIIDIEVAKLPGIKARFGGDIGPQLSDSIFEKAGLYFETILIPDPLIRVCRIPSAATKNIDFYFLKYSINQVLLKDIFLADVYPPIAILTDDIEFNTENRNVAAGLATFDTIAFVNELYRSDFDTLEDIKKFFSKFKTIYEAVESTSNPEVFYWSENASRNPIDQVESLMEHANKELGKEAFPERYDSSSYLLRSIYSRMLQSNSVLFTAQLYNSHPLIAAPVSFHWFTQKKYSNQKLTSELQTSKNSLELVATNALLSKNLDWLSNISINNLIELRRRSQLSDIRSIIHKQLVILSSPDTSNLDALINQVDYNLSSELSKHQENVKQLDSSFRTELGILGPTFLASLTASIQPTLLPNAPEWIAIIGNIVGTTSFASIVRELVQYMRDKKKLKESPIGILWSAKQKNESDN